MNGGKSAKYDIIVATNYRPFDLAFSSVPVRTGTYLELDTYFVIKILNIAIYSHKSCKCSCNSSAIPTGTPFKFFYQSTLLPVVLSLNSCMLCVQYMSSFFTIHVLIFLSEELLSSELNCQNIIFRRWMEHSSLLSFSFQRSTDIFLCSMYMLLAQNRVPSWSWKRAWNLILVK